MILSQLDRSIFWAVLQGMIGVMVLFCAIDFLFGLLDLMSDINDNFTLSDAILASILQLPDQFIEFISVASLIGALVALGVKASHGELVVMRAAGWSKTRILVPALAAALFMSALSLGLAEYVIPKSSQLKHNRDSSGSQPLWLRDGNTFARVDSVSVTGELQGLTLVEVSEGEIQQVRQAVSATYQQGQWVLRDVKSTVLLENAVEAAQASNGYWSPKAGPREFLSIARPPEHLAISQLFRFIDYRREQGLDVRRYTLNLWKTLLQPFANLVMVFLASSLVFGSMRMVSMGYRLTLGLMFGLGFYYAQDLFGFVTLVYGVHPLLSLAIPIAVFLILAWSRFRD